MIAVTPKRTNSITVFRKPADNMQLRKMPEQSEWLLIKESNVRARIAELREFDISKIFVIIPIRRCPFSYSKFIAAVIPCPSLELTS